MDHLELDEVCALVERIDREHGRLDVVVNDIWGGDIYLTFGLKLWEHLIEYGSRMLRLGIDTHAITSHFATPLLNRNPGALVIEMTTGRRSLIPPSARPRASYYDSVKVSVQRMALAQSQELRPYDGTGVSGPVLIIEPLPCDGRSPAALPPADLSKCPTCVDPYDPNPDRSGALGFIPRPRALSRALQRFIERTSLEFKPSGPFGDHR